jgi:signal transduction histidine kinase
MSIHMWDEKTISPQLQAISRRQQIKLLNNILLLFIPITLFFSIFNVIVMSNFEVLFKLSSFLDALVGLVVLLLVYIINRIGHYNLAVGALILLSGLTITVHVLQSSPPHLEMTHYIILLMLAKPLLAERELLLTTLFILINITITSLVVDTIPLFAAWNVGTFVVVIYFLLWVISSYRSGLETDRQALIQSGEVRLRALLDQVPGLVWVIDRDMNVKSFNGNQQDLIEDFSSYLTEICHHCEAQLEQDSTIVFDHKWNEHFYQNTIQPQMNLKGDVIGFLGTTIDLTERKISEAKLIDLMVEKERQQAATDFINSASHDFRTPLSVVTTSIFLLKNSREEDRPRHIDNLQTSVDRLNKMLDDMFYIVKLDTYSGEMKPVAINGILRDIISRYHSKNSEYEHKFTTHIGCTDTCTVVGDTAFLDRAISNVLDNAFQYTTSSNAVELDIRNVDTNVQITVINHGQYIAEAHLPYIFNHFFRGEDHRSLENNNSGLGLTITKKIIDLVQGTIHVENLDSTGVKVTMIIPNESIRRMLLTSTV